MVTTAPSTIAAKRAALRNRQKPTSTGATAQHHVDHLDHLSRADPLTFLCASFDRNKLRFKTKALIRFPDTIVYEHHFPKWWYMWVSGPSVMKKPAKECDTTSIMDAFAKGSGNEDIVAIFVQRMEEISHTEERMAISDKNIMHITKAELFTFLINPPARGILQRWITPQRKRDHCIHATWKPHVFLCERVQNVYQVDDPKVSLERRTAGDLGGVDVQMASCAPDLVKRIRSMCEALASETRRCDRVNIVHMQLRFKLDEHNHMWMLFASDLQLRLVPGNLDLGHNAVGAEPVLERLKLRRLNNCVQTKKTPRLSHSPMVNAALFAKSLQRGHPSGLENTIVARQIGALMLSRARSNLGDASVLGSDDGLLRPGSQVLMRPPSGSIEWWEEVLSAERERAEEESTVGSLGSLSSDEGSYEPEEEAGAAVPSDAPSRSSREPCGPMDAATEQETSTSLSRVLSTPQCDDSGTDPATAGEAHPCRVPSLAPTGTDPPSDCDSSQGSQTVSARTEEDPEAAVLVREFLLAPRPTPGGSSSGRRRPNARGRPASAKFPQRNGPAAMTPPRPRTAAGGRRGPAATPESGARRLRGRNPLPQVPVQHANRTRATGKTAGVGKGRSSDADKGKGSGEMLPPAPLRVNGRQVSASVCTLDSLRSPTSTAPSSPAKGAPAVQTPGPTTPQTEFPPQQPPVPMSAPRRSPRGSPTSTFSSIHSPKSSVCPSSPQASLPSPAHSPSRALRHPKTDYTIRADYTLGLERHSRPSSPHRSTRLSPPSSPGADGQSPHEASFLTVPSLSLPNAQGPGTSARRKSVLSGYGSARSAQRQSPRPGKRRASDAATPRSPMSHRRTGGDTAQSRRGSGHDPRVPGSVSPKGISPRDLAALDGTALLTVRKTHRKSSNMSSRISPLSSRMASRHTSASGDDAAAFMVEVDFQLDSEEEDKYAFWRDSSDEEEVQSHYAYVDEAIQGLAAEFIQSLPSARAARYRNIYDMYVAAMDYIRDLLYQAYSHHLLHSSPFRFHVPLGLCSQAQMQELGATWGIAHEGDQWYHVHVESKDRMGYVGQQMQVAKTTNTKYTDTNKEPP